MKNKKKTFIIICIVFSFFFNVSYLSAASSEARVNTFIMPDACYNTNNKGALCDIDNKYKTKYYLKGVVDANGNYKTRWLSNVGLFTYNEGSLKNIHAYCIEPGVAVGDGYSSAGMWFSSYKGLDPNGKKVNQNTFDDNKREKVSQILTFAKNLGTNLTMTSSSIEDRYKVYAAQGLIWEVITGERTRFDVDKPDKAISTNFYSAINSTMASAKKVKEEYMTILTKIRGTYLSEPGTGVNKFKVNQALAATNPRPLNCNGTTCSLKIEDPNFVYWDIKDSEGLKINKTVNSITITTDEVIDIKTPKTITLRINGGNKGDAKAFYSETKQDIVTIAGVDRNLYLKVYTPKYQLKVIKKSSSSFDNLSGLPLNGVKFNVCSDRECKKSLTTLTTDKNGVATYGNIPKPGTYYIKEISSIPGYILNNSIRKVEVKNTDVAGTTSYGTITIENSTKEFNLIKYTVDEDGNRTKSDDGCGSSTYTGAKFQISENGHILHFSEISQGIYKPVPENTQGAVTELKTCKGEFKVYALPNCKYTITETETPAIMINASKATKNVNICGSDKSVSFTNGFTGLEFHKKDEKGNFIIGGKFSLQMKINNIYTDLLLREIEQGFYEYDADLDEDDPDATYIIRTTGNSEEDEDKGKSFIKRLPPGDYRVVEKEAPDGYEYIEDRNSTAIVTIKDSEKEDYYLTELVNRKTSQFGSDDYAELIVTITTGRKVPNYVVIISVLIILLVVSIIIRKRYKK